MAKILVVKSGEFKAQETAEKLVAELKSLRDQLVEITGVKTVKDDKGNESEVPDKTFTVDPDTKAEIKRLMNFGVGVFMANKKLSNTGRDPKADLASLQRVYVDYIRGHRTQNRSLAAMNIAVQYNNGKTEDQHITSGYVERAAKKNNWDSLIDVPEPEPATA